MKERAVLISYLVVASAAFFFIPTVISLSTGYPGYFFGTFLGIFYPAYFLAVAGLVLGPYFALAGLIARNKSVWVEANRMLHTYISIPIAGGLALLYGSFLGYGFVAFLLRVYAIFVFLATLITFMASRAEGSEVAAAVNSTG